MGLLVPDKSDTVEGINPQPRPAHNIIPVNDAHLGKTAVLAVVPVISQNKVLVLSQGDRLPSRSRILYALQAVVLLQHFAVNIDITLVVNLYRLSGKADDPLDIVSIR